jgi:hypothetical protein
VTDALELPVPQFNPVRCLDCGQVVEKYHWEEDVGGRTMVLDHECPAHDAGFDDAMEQFKADNAMNYHKWYDGLKAELAYDLGILIRQQRSGVAIRGHSVVVSLRVAADTLERLDHIAIVRQSNRSEVMREILDQAAWT